MKQEQALDKIKKLLALSENNPSEGESKAALLKAQKLMAEYDIAMEDMENSETAENLIVYCEHKWNFGYRKALASVISKNFRVETFISKQQVCFFGHRLDAEIAKNTFETAYRVINTLANRAYYSAKADGRETVGVYNSYANGFIFGLKQALDAQCTALLIVTPEDVKTEFKEMTSGWKVRSRKLPPHSDYSAYMSGVADGKSFLGKKQIQG